MAEGPLPLTKAAREWRGGWERRVSDGGEVGLTGLMHRSCGRRRSVWRGREKGMGWDGVGEGEREREKCHPTSSESLLLQIDCWQLGERRETAIMHILQPHYVNRSEYKCSFSINPIPSVCSVVSVNVRADCQLDLMLCCPVEKSHFIIVSGWILCVCVCLMNLKPHVTDNGIALECIAFDCKFAYSFQLLFALFAVML